MKSPTDAILAVCLLVLSVLHLLAYFGMPPLHLLTEPNHFLTFLLTGLLALFFYEKAKFGWRR